jgi:hypothetical protein
MSLIIASSEISLTSQSDSPFPRWSKRTSRQWRANSAKAGLQTGLRHS